MGRMTECLFCKIIAGEIPAEKVYEDTHSIAFLDINPVNPGHVLVITREHSRNMLETDTGNLEDLIRAVQNVANALMKGSGAAGVNVIFNNEAAAGQLIYHTHAHVIPRFEGDGIHNWPQKKYESDAVMRGVAEKIRKAI